MAKIIIQDGEEYPLPSNFTFREMNLIKRTTGLRAGELAEGFEKGDTDVLLAFAAIARFRATGDAAYERLLDLDVQQIRIDFKEDEVTPDPLEESVSAETAEADAADEPSQPTN